jgi:hypothetical protein
MVERSPRRQVVGSNPAGPIKLIFSNFQALIFEPELFSGGPRFAIETIITEIFKLDNGLSPSYRRILRKINFPPILDHASFDGVPDVLQGQITATQI